MSEPDPESLIEFPCYYEVKVMGKDGGDFHSDVRRIVNVHCKGVSEDHFRQRASAKGKYSSVTAKVYVESREHLEALYGDLRASEHVLYTL